jgi:hypothetical protein
MAKEIKVFSGTVTETTTIYTVPAGRVAKVTLSYFKGLNAGTPRNITLKIGVASILINRTTDTGNSTRYVGQASVASGSTNAVYSAPSGYTYISSFGAAGVVSVAAEIIPLNYFMNAGETVEIAPSNTGTTSTYTFLVVEEF